MHTSSPRGTCSVGIRIINPSPSYFLTMATWTLPTTRIHSSNIPSTCTPTRTCTDTRLGTNALQSLESLKAYYFTCAICLETLSDTHVTPDCLHRFCGDCIKESLRKCNNQCPTCTCRAAIPTQRSLRPDKLYGNLVSM